MTVSRSRVLVAISIVFVGAVLFVGYNAYKAFWGGIDSDYKLQISKEIEEINKAIGEDLTPKEEGGETLGSVQKRNIEALNEVLLAHRDRNIVIGTHGTALSTIMNFYDPSYGLDFFMRIWHCMPCVIRLDFDETRNIGKQELLMIDRGY